jgi:hypothetical protein
VTESIEANGASRTSTPRLSNAVVGFEVVDRNGERVGEVGNVNLEHTCIVVHAGRSLFGRRKESHAVHALAVREIDLDAFRIVLSASKQEVDDAPELHELDSAAEEAVARYYERLNEERAELV